MAEIVSLGEAAAELVRGDNRSLCEIVNVNGGAIAVGHPLGASGARVLGGVCHELRRRGGGYGLAALCLGVGQGVAVVVHA